jgi:hypothetical protein
VTVGITRNARESRLRAKALPQRAGRNTKEPGRD